MDELSLDVSRETIERLEAYVDLVKKWNPKINLVSKASLGDIWHRHILDSAQLFDLAPDSESWVDLGSGGGFPGIVLSILALERNPKGRFTLVESDQRKSAFLRTAIRELDLNAKVLAQRIEDVPPLKAQALSARALADLDILLGFGAKHLASDGTALFPKGESWEKEDRAARERWSYSCEVITSKTNPDAAVLKIKDILRV